MQDRTCPQDELDGLKFDLEEDHQAVIQNAQQLNVCMDKVDMLTNLV